MNTNTNDNSITQQEFMARIKFADGRIETRKYWADPNPEQYHARAKMHTASEDTIICIGATGLSRRVLPEQAGIDNDGWRVAELPNFATYGRGPMHVEVAPGQALRVTLADTDGEIFIAYTEDSFVITADLPDSTGREGVIYEEAFGAGPGMEGLIEKQDA